MTTHPSSRRIQLSRIGFTLVELLIGMTIIAILAGLITVAANGAFVRARVFAVQTEMSQIEQALEQFEIEYGFYPPSFRDLVIGDMLPILGKIAPNHGEGDGSMGTGLATWWTAVGAELVAAANSDPSTPGSLAGSDLVFWLSGLAKNKQFPLTGTGDRQNFFEFDQTRLNFSATGNTANFYQAGRVATPYLYRDAGTYLPTMPDMDDSADGAYVRTGVVKQQIIDAAFHLNPAQTGVSPGMTADMSRTIFNTIYFKPNSFQLITLGQDGLPGGPTTCPTPGPANPNTISMTCSRGADNIVNFGGTGPRKLDTIVAERQ